MLPVVAYFRMSSDDQEGSLPAQRAWASAAAAREALDLVAAFEDAATPGGHGLDRRPGLAALLDECERRFRAGAPVSAVLVWDPDRLSRASSIQTSAVLARLQDAGVYKLLTNSDGWLDLDDATARVLYLIKQDLGRAGFCEGLARNVLRGQAAAAARGEWAGGRPPLGYRLEGKRLAPDGDSAAAVAWAFRAYASGTHSLRTLADGLAARGVAPARGRCWWPTTVRQMLANRVYLGELVWNLRHAGRYARFQGGRVSPDASARPREQDRRRRDLAGLPLAHNAPGDVVTVPGAHPALVDAATFDAVAERLAAHRKRSAPVRGGGGWVLTGLVRCGVCGGPMHGRAFPSKPGVPPVTYRYYACDRARRARAAPGVAGCGASKLVQQDALVSLVADEVRRRFADDDAVAAVRAEMDRVAGAGEESRGAERAALLARLAQLDADVARGTANLARVPEDLVDGVVAAVRAAQAERDRVRLQLGRLDAADREGEALPARLGETLAMLRALPDLLRAATPAEARAVLGSVVARVTVHLTGTGRHAVLDHADVEMAPAVADLFSTSQRCEQVRNQPLTFTSRPATDAHRSAA